MGKEVGKTKSAKAVLRLVESGKEDPSHPSRVEQALNNTEGVLKVEVNHLTSALSIEYDPDMITIDEIRKAIEKTRG